MARIDGRAADQLRPVKITPNVQEFAEGSVMIETGLTRVLCAVSVQDSVPPFLRDSGQGWVTAEYSMLPRSTSTRTQRENRGPRGRTQEIQRLIGRSLRAAVNLEKLGERSFLVDCDVLQADGGTRTAAITGAYVALYQAIDTLVKAGRISQSPVKYAVAATSVGIIGDEVLLDLCYEEDYKAEVDFNVVMTDKDEFIEVQGTAEGDPFSKDALDAIVSVAKKGIDELFEAQQQVIGSL